MTNSRNNPYAVLWEPMKIGRMRLRNRLVMSPMGTFTPMQDGTDSEEGIAYYEARAKGGMGLIITGAMFINKDLAQGSPTIAVDNMAALPKTTVMTERVHRWGAKMCLQLSPGTGRNGVLYDENTKLYSSSENASFYNPDYKCTPLSVEQIHAALKDWEKAANFAKLAGFDAIEIHAHAGYLIDQFISTIWNHRTDEYGGSLENRCRFPKEIIETVRKVVGPDFPILYRIALEHRFPGGRTLAETMPVIEYLEKCGVDAFDVDCGSYENMDYIFPTSYNGEGCMAYVCEEARKHVKVPLINAGSHSPETALALVKSGNADFVMFGRQSIADPEFPNKLRDNDREDIRPCLICNEECIGRIFGRSTQLSCAVNSCAGLEEYMKIEKTAHPQRIAVIGSGPAGCEAARVAALEGHKVTIYEKDDHLGGTFRTIATAHWKTRIRSLMAWYERQLLNLGVEIKLNTCITPDSLELEAADKVIVATGSKSITPKIPGIDGRNVIGVIDAHRMGLDKITGGKIAICGGGLSGCDAALELAMNGKEVTVLEMLGSCARDVMPINQISLFDQLKKYHVNLKVDSKVTAIDASGVTISGKDGKTEKIAADCVITAFGQKADDAFADAILAKYNVKTVVIGDALKAGKAGAAIRGGFYAAMQIQ